MLRNSPMTIAVVLEYRRICYHQLLTPSHAGVQWKGKFICSFLPVSRFRVFLDPASLVFGEIMNY